MTVYQKIKELSLEDMAAFIAGLVVTSTVSALSTIGVPLSGFDSKATLSSVKESMITLLNEESEDGKAAGSTDLYSNE